MFKELTSASGNKVAVNPLHVMNIYRLLHPKYTELKFTNGSTMLVTEEYKFVVELLSIMEN